MKTLFKSLVMLSLFATSAIAATDTEVVPTASVAHVVSVRIETINGGINPNFVGANVYATVRAGNACMMPQLFAKELKVRGETNVYRLLTIGSSRMCPMVYSPVTKEVLVDQLHTEFTLPTIIVNGKKAEATVE